MKEHPILFSPQMVRAILDGRKTQTRRIMKPQPADDIHRATFPNPKIIGWKSSLNHAHGSTTAHFCPFGQVGNRLWVRETWSVVTHAFNDDGDIINWNPDRPATAIEGLKYGQGYYSGHVIYAADGPFEWCDDDGNGSYSAWHPSIHMPRSASRITLEITNVRVERLQNISEEDALAEGIEILDGILDDDVINFSGRTHMVIDSAITWYAALWEKLCGRGSWEVNPWVWVIDFKVVK